MHSYPTLSLLDRALGADHRRFAADRDAISLERRARQLVDDYWGDSVWLTGRGDTAAFSTVCEALERERSARDSAVVVVMTVPEGVAPPALEFSRQPEAAIEVIAVL
jgi:hypothetical protein